VGEHQGIYFLGDICQGWVRSFRYAAGAPLRGVQDSLRGALLANSATRWLPTAMENKWYVDELYHALIRGPLWVASHAMYLFDRYIIDALIVNGVARIPRILGRGFQPLQNGVLQSYAITMAGGVVLLALLVVMLPNIVEWINGWTTGGAG
jgi:NADH:ubiquinone oxidoreductase subunit 5 (subunit L)/multisubunit Na+/H+ antiporter MnhA subunit